MKRQQYYVTTPIYYVNGNPHIGHAHTTVMGDIFKRAMKMCGISVFYTTGVDEHGQKNSTEVENSGLTAKQYLDRQSRKFKDLFALLTVEYDFFVRTSGPEHKKAVSVFLQKLYDSGQIIKKEYTGLYCSGCEQFKTDSDLDEEGKCPDHHVKPLLEKETNYFFPLEPYRDWLAEYIMDNRSWINPESYRSQVLDMLRGSLPDLCVSRPKSRVPLGIELPFDRDFVVYVWFDALINYISSIGFPDDGNDFRSRWENSCHLMAKDIIKTHCIYWPIMLKAAGLEPASANFIHGFWVGEDGRKMAKSLGNGVDPAELVERYGADPLRAYLAAKISRNESRIGDALFRNFYNSFFANMLGNVYLRSGKLLEKYTGGMIPETDPENGDLAFLDRLVSAAEDHRIAGISFERISSLMEGLEFIGSELNKYINDRKPWALDQYRDVHARNSILRTCMEGIRILFEAGWPVIPGTAEKVLASLGSKVPGTSGEHSFIPLALEAGRKIARTEMLFPRMADDQL